MSMTVVDLGTKFGKSISTFLMKPATFFPAHIQSGTFQTTPDFDCTGVDIDKIYRRDLEGRGHRFMRGDLRSRNFRKSLPEADFYLVCNILHHVDAVQALEILCDAVQKARRGVWFRVKSFEQDDKNGEGVLTAMGLQFSWTRNYSSYTMAELLTFINKTRLPGATVRIEPGKSISHTKDKRVIPLWIKNDSKDSYFYERTMGVKEYMELPKPVVCEWDIFVENEIYEANADKT